MAKSEILRAKNLHKTFYHPVKTHVLKGIDLTVHSGEAIAITGRSGEGKSTLLQVLGTLEHPCEGSLEISGITVTAMNKSHIRNQKIAFVFQSFHLLEDYTAMENVLMPARIARKNISRGSPAYMRAYELLDEMGLEDRIHFDTKLLSGGEKQRVAIARALCNDPDVIFADEPSGNLDKQTAESIHKVLLNFAHHENKGVIIVTHDTALASRCDRHCVLLAGQLSENIKG